MSTLLHDPPDGHQLLTVAEAAAALGTRPRTILYYLDCGRFPHAFKTPGGRWRIPVGDVAAARAEVGIDGDGHHPPDRSESR